MNYEHHTASYKTPALIVWIWFAAPNGCGKLDANCCMCKTLCQAWVCWWCTVESGWNVKSCKSHNHGGRTIIGFLHVPILLIATPTISWARKVVRMQRFWCNFQKLVHVFGRASFYWLQAMSFMGKPKGAACRPRIFELLQLDVRGNFVGEGFRNQNSCIKHWQRPSADDCFADSEAWGSPVFHCNLSRKSLLSKGLEILGLGFKEKLHEILLHKLLREIYTLLMESKDGKSRSSSEFCSCEACCWNRRPKGRNGRQGELVTTCRHRLLVLQLSMLRSQYQGILGWMSWCNFWCMFFEQQVFIRY